MLTADGCAVSKVHIGGKEYPRIRYGDPEDLFTLSDEERANNRRCFDCGAKPGHYHHWGCDSERCPACHQQLISCLCENVYVKRVMQKKGDCHAETI